MMTVWGYGGRTQLSGLMEQKLGWSNVSTKITWVDLSGRVEHGSKPGMIFILIDNEVPELAILSWLQ